MNKIIITLFHIMLNCFHFNICQNPHDKMATSTSVLILVALCFTCLLSSTQAGGYGLGMYGRGLGMYGYGRMMPMYSGMHYGYGMGIGLAMPYRYGMGYGIGMMGGYGYY